jgi:hypothetical protein
MKQLRQVLVDHLKRLALVVIRHSNLADCGKRVRGRRGRVRTHNSRDNRSCGVR